MTVGVVMLVFLGLVLALSLLPLVPAVREWRRPTDVAPLRVSQFSAVDARQFARGFRVYVETSLAGPLMAEPPLPEGVLSDGTPFLFADADGRPRLSPVERAEGRVRRLVVAAGDVHLWENTYYGREVYSRGSIEVGEGSTVRAALADVDIRMKPRSRSLRWLHADGRVVGEAGCVLHGRVTSRVEIRLRDGVAFERLNAPRIAFGSTPASRERPAGSGQRERPILDPEAVPHLVSTETGRWLVEGDFSVPADTVVPADVVATGRVRVGPGARVDGGLKSHAEVRLGAGVEVQGAVVGVGRLTVGEGSRIAGPVLAEAAIELGCGVVVGAPHRPTTVSAPRIRAGAGTVCHGTVWARVEGRAVLTVASGAPIDASREVAA